MDADSFIHHAIVFMAAVALLGLALRIAPILFATAIIIALYVLLQIAAAKVDHSHSPFEYIGDVDEHGLLPGGNHRDSAWKAPTRHLQDEFFRMAAYGSMYQVQDMIHRYSGSGQIDINAVDVVSVTAS
jgi:hypothetical protein